MALIRTLIVGVNFITCLFIMANTVRPRRRNRKARSPLAGPSIGIGGLVGPDRGVEIGSHLLFAGHSGVVVRGG